MTRVVAYLRVSTDEQADEGVSLDVQHERCTAYAGLYGLEVVATMRDPGRSAKSLARPGLARALELLDAGDVAGVLVTKLDRLTRSVRDLGELLERYFSERKGKLLFAVQEQIDTRTATGRLCLHMLGAVSQWEREVIAERTRAAMQHIRSSGRHTGGSAPYGYRVGRSGKLVEVLDEQATIRRAGELHDGGASLRAVAAVLEREGRPTRGGSSWSPMQVARLVRARAR